MHITGHGNLLYTILSMFNICSSAVLSHKRWKRPSLVGQIGLIDLIGQLFTPLVSVHATIIIALWNLKLYHYCYKNDSKHSIEL